MMQKRYEGRMMIMVMIRWWW